MKVSGVGDKERAEKFLKDYHFRVKDLDNIDEIDRIISSKIFRIQLEWMFNLSRIWERDWGSFGVSLVDALILTHLIDDRVDIGKLSLQSEKNLIDYYQDYKSILDKTSITQFEDILYREFKELNFFFTSLNKFVGLDYHSLKSISQIIFSGLIQRGLVKDEGFLQAIFRNSFEFEYNKSYGLRHINYFINLRSTPAYYLFLEILKVDIQNNLKEANLFELLFGILAELTSRKDDDLELPPIAILKSIVERYIIKSLSETKKDEFYAKNLILLKGLFENINLFYKFEKSDILSEYIELINEIIRKYF